VGLAACASGPPETEPISPPVASALGSVRASADPSAETRGAEPVREVQTSAGMCRIRFDGAAHLTTTECVDERGTRIWGRDEAQAREPEGVVAADESNLYVARYSPVAAGCEVVAYALKSGAIVGRRRLRSIPDVERRDETNAVEMRLTHGKLRVLGWQAKGKYVEEIDPATDLAPARAPDEPAHPGAAAGLKFVFDGARPDYRISASASAARGVTCTITVNQATDTTHLECAVSGARAWGIDLAEQFVAGAAMAASNDAIFVVNYCAIATGAIVTAYEATSGRILWTTVLYAAGPISHSKYFNDVAVRVEASPAAPAQIVVSGWESGGKYVEVLDASTGQDLGSRPEP
jgi:hypothetical protein